MSELLLPLLLYAMLYAMPPPLLYAMLYAMPPLLLHAMLLSFPCRPAVRCSAGRWAPRAARRCLQHWMVLPKLLTNSFRPRLCTPLAQPCRMRTRRCSTGKCCCATSGATRPAPGARGLRRRCAVFVWHGWLLERNPSWCCGCCCTCDLSSVQRSACPCAQPCATAKGCGCFWCMQEDRAGGKVWHPLWPKFRNLAVR